jgi:L-lactate dehydrogenase complex protein LldG
MASPLTARLLENSCVVHEVDRTAATALVTERVAAHAAHGTVAVAVADAFVAELGVLDALRARGVDVLVPDDPGWRDALPAAAVGLTGARLAVVEPATIALECGPGSPRAVSLLPPVHVCVLRASDIVTTFADAVAAVSCGPLPSALTWVGGPSRTGDLEMVQTLGVHGPIVVEVVIVDG